MLFSTTFMLGPNKLPIQLQVSQGPSSAQSGAPGPPCATHRALDLPSFVTAPHPLSLALVPG